MANIKQEMEQANNRPLFVCSNGLKLRLRAVPALATQAIVRQLREPPVPTFFNEEKQRDEENPNDPEYIRASNQYRIDLAELTTTAYLANGISIQEPLPDELLPVDSDEWCEGLQAVGLEIPTNGLMRRVAWLKYYALPDENLGDLIAAIAIAGGSVTEEDVAAAAETFRNNGLRDANTEIPEVTEIRPRDTSEDTRRDSK